MFCWKRLFRSIFLVTLLIRVVDAHAYSDGYGNEYVFNYEQYNTTYQANDRDFGFKGTGSATVDSISGEFRWQQMRVQRRKWRWLGSVNLQFARQAVLGNSYLLPQVSSRLYYGYDKSRNSRWRPAAALSAYYGREVLVDAYSPTGANMQAFWRYGFGVGPALAWRWRTYSSFADAPYRDFVTLNWLALVRWDSGGTYPFIPNPLQASLGYQLEMNGTLWITPWTGATTAIRYYRESFEWTPAVGGSTNSSMVNSYVGATFGISIKF